MTRPDEIRKELLLQLYAVRPLALSADRLARDARKQSYDYSATEIRCELQFLTDNGLIVESADPAVTAKLYRIHAAGVTRYEQNYAL